MDFDHMSATFTNPLISPSAILDFGVRLGMPWSDTALDIKIRNTPDGRGTLFLTRSHRQIDAIYWGRTVSLNEVGIRTFKIEFQVDQDVMIFVVNGVEYPIAYPPIDFGSETFQGIAFFVNSELRQFDTKGAGFVRTPYVSITNFQIQNNETVLVP